MDGHGRPGWGRGWNTRHGWNYDRMGYQGRNRERHEEGGFAGRMLARGWGYRNDRLGYDRGMSRGDFGGARDFGGWHHGRGYDQGYDRGFGSQLREGWNNLRRGMRETFGGHGGGYDRGYRPHPHRRGYDRWW